MEVLSMRHHDKAKAPNQSGEERKRTCPRCKEVTWHTFKMTEWGILRSKWVCNQCGKATSI